MPATSTAPPLTRLSTEEAMFRDAVREFADQEVRPRVAQMEKRAALDPELIRKFFELGLMGIEIPETYGGAGGTLFMTVLAVEGSYASVIGGAPAAAVVFAGDVNERTANDPRVRELEELVAAADGPERAAQSLKLADVRAEVRAEKLGEVAAEFDRVHSIQRAVEVGSVDAIVRADELRPRIIDAIEKAAQQR